MKSAATFLAAAFCAAVLVAGAVLGASRPPPAAENTAEKAEIAQAVNAFACDLYGKVRSQEGNVFFSPYSIESALTMTWTGAKGETAAEMARALRFPAARQATPEWVTAAFGYLSADFSGAGKPYELSVANALWGQKGYPFKPEFVAALRKDFGAGVFDLDFAGDPAGAAGRINGWCAKETHDRIKEIVSPQDLAAQIRLVLTNAIYFLGTWQKPFKAERTGQEDFLVAAGKKIGAPMMHETAHYKYAETDAFQAAELAYKGGDLSMVILLPKAKDGLAAVEASLSANKLTEWIAALQWQYLDLAVPRFTFEWKADLNDPLRDLGMALAFQPGKADFSAINGGAEPMWISFVKHKAFVKVDEKGTEAAAVTAVGVAATAMPPQPIAFRADHPFLFLIRDVRSGCVLFLGRVVEPKE